MNGHFYKAKHAAAQMVPTKRLEGVHISGPSSPTGVYRSLQEEKKESTGKDLQEEPYRKE